MSKKIGSNRKGLSLLPLTTEEAVSDLLKIKPAHRLTTKGGKPRREEKKK